MKPFAVGAAVDVGCGGAVVGGGHAVFVGVGDVGGEFFGGERAAKGHRFGAGGVEGPEEGGHQEELGVVAEQMLVGQDFWWDGGRRGRVRVNLGGGSVDTIFLLQ